MSAPSNCLRCAGQSRKRFTVPDVGLTLLVEAAVEQIGRGQHALRIWIAELKLSAFVEIGSCVSTYQVTSRTGFHIDNDTAPTPLPPFDAGQKNKYFFFRHIVTTIGHIVCRTQHNITLLTRPLCTIVHDVLRQQAERSSSKTATVQQHIKYQLKVAV
jgi:hypothetical protein